MDGRAVAESHKEIVIIAGPNGAGKTTFAFSYLDVEARGLAFVNADLIAAGLSPLDPQAAAVKAGRLTLAEIDRLVAEGRSFAFETTLAGRGYLRRIDSWRRIGYRVTLLFLSLPSPEEAVDRVRYRVAQGGHNIPEDVIHRRFEAGLENLRERYTARVDQWILYDNQGRVPVVVERSDDRDRPH